MEWWQLFDELSHALTANVLPRYRATSLLSDLILNMECQPGSHIKWRTYMKLKMFRNVQQNKFHHSGIWITSNGSWSSTYQCSNTDVIVDRDVKQSSNFRSSGPIFEFGFVFQPFDIRFQATLIRRIPFCPKNIFGFASIAMERCRHTVNFSVALCDVISLFFAGRQFKLRRMFAYPSPLFLSYSRTSMLHSRRAGGRHMQCGRATWGGWLISYTSSGSLFTIEHTTGYSRHVVYMRQAY